MLTMLADQLVSLFRIPETSMANAVVCLVRAINKKCNTNADPVVSNTTSVEGPNAKRLLQMVRDME